MNEIERLAEIIDGRPLTPEGKCFEEYDSWSEWNKYRQESLSRAKRVLDAGYLPVEEVQLEGLTEELKPIMEKGILDVVLADEASRELTRLMQAIISKIQQAWVKRSTSNPNSFQFGG